MEKKSVFIGMIIGIACTIGIYTAGVQIQRVFQKPKSSNITLKQPVDESERVVDEEGDKDLIMATVQDNNKINPQTNIVERIYNSEGETTYENMQKAPKDWVNKTEEELKELLGYTEEWKVVKFSNKEVVIEKHKQKSQYQYVLILTEDHYLASYHLTDEGVIGELDEVYRNIPLDFLPENHLEEIKNGGKRFESKEKLNEYIESFHG